MKTIKIFSVFILALIMISSCTKSGPSKLFFQGNDYSLTSSKESRGGKFSILEYSGGKDKIFLMSPHKETDLGVFSNIYTSTFKAQGFSFSSEGNKHLGLSNSNIVYLTVSPQLKSLSILLVEKGNSKPETHGEASGIFRDLEGLY